MKGLFTLVTQKIMMILKLKILFEYSSCKAITFNELLQLLFKKGFLSMIKS